MARPIKETPILFGKDAERFEQAMKELKPFPPERIAAMRKSYEHAKSQWGFNM